MKRQLGVRALLLLALVAAATCAIVKPDLFGGTAQPHTTDALARVMLHHP